MWRLEHPYFLFGFLLVAAAAYFLFRYLQWRSQARNALLSARLQAQLFEDSRKSRQKAWIWLALLSLLVLAAADFRISKGLTETTSRETVVMIALDLSTSMLAEDTRPNRCAYAKRMLEQWVRQAPAQTRIGLMSFAATTQVETSPTLDHEYVLSRLMLLEPEQMMVQGTDLTLCLRNATKLLASQESTPLLLLVTDAEDHSTETLSALKKATEAGLAILPIGVGTEQGAPVPSGGSGSAYLRDEQGNLVRSARNDALLQNLAEGGGTGIWIEADGATDVIQKINAVREQFEKGTLRTYRAQDYLPRYKWFLVPALLLLLWLIRQQPK